MTCDQDQVVAFLNGELSDADAQVFDEHLLTCEACWRAVREDRIGRLALERLRVPAPLGLADRVSVSVDLAAKAPTDGRASTSISISTPDDQGRSRRPATRPPGRARRFVTRHHQHPHPHPHRYRLPAAVAAALALVIIGGSLGWALRHRPAGDPAQIADVVAMMTPQVDRSPALRRGEQFDLGGQSVTVRSYVVEGIVTLVATSERPFPLPSSVLRGSSSRAWMATHGALGMYGVNHPAGSAERSMLVVAAMPVAQLPQVAVRLHLT